MFSVGTFLHQAAEIHVNKLQSELGECTTRKDVLEKMLAQKELQILDLQEQQGALCAERDGLRGALQLLKSQHSSVVKEAQEQTQRRMVSYETHLHKLYAGFGSSVVLIVIGGHLMLWQQKEKETKKLRDSLEKQKQEAKSHELQQGAAKHVQIIFCNIHSSTQDSRCSVVSLQVKEAVEEERRRCEAEKVEAVRVQRGTLEEQIRQRLGSMRNEIQRERSVALALKQEVAELKTVRPLTYDITKVCRTVNLCFVFG